MVRNVKSVVGGAYLRCRGVIEESSSSARIGKVKRTVEKAGEFEDGPLLSQGCGNDLENDGQKDTARGLVEAVKAVEDKNVSVAVTGVPTEGASEGKGMRGAGKGRALRFRRCYYGRR